MQGTYFGVSSSLAVFGTEAWPWALRTAARAQVGLPRQRGTATEGPPTERETQGWRLSSAMGPPSTSLPPSRSHRSVPPAPAAQTRSDRGTTPGRRRHLSGSAARARPSTGVTWKVSQNAQLLPAQSGETWLDTGTCPETTMWARGFGVQGKIHFTPTLISYQGHNR